MVRVTVRRGFTPEEKSAAFEEALRIFKKRVNKDEIIAETKKRAFYEKPSTVRRRKVMTAKRKERKRALKNR